MTETTDDTHPIDEPAPRDLPTTHELDAPPWLRVETTLMATAGLIRDAFDCRLRPLSLNLTQASLLSYVAEFGPVSQRKIADHLGNGRAATGASIDRLEQRGLVERLPDPADRRVWLVAVTAEGARCTEAVREIDEVLRAELRAGIDRAERQALASLMTRLQQNLRTAIRKTQ
ncbi:MAG: MarR family transcriptional regulator [Actinomycetota bacterium]|nr:MarR family transcriptional regulator [Actinomycetota bacterium]